MKYPKISVITPSYNQGRFIEANIRSVLDQGYPNIEHIIIDGGSKDGTLEIIKKYPHLTVIAEPDNGQSEAINKGLRISSGDIIAWLNSDDMYMPGAFKRVVEELNKEKCIYVVMGRCIFIDEEGLPTGIFHPSAFKNHRRVVTIWKGYSIPQPSVFFYREILAISGMLDENLHFCMDYDLWLRVSKHYRFHCIPQILATYRLQNESKTLAISEEELLRRAVTVSRKYWGTPFLPGYWYYRLSYLRYQLRSSLKWTYRASSLWNSSVDLIKQGKRVKGWMFRLTSVLMFPPLLYIKNRYLARTLFMKIFGEKIAIRIQSYLARNNYENSFIQSTKPFTDGWAPPVIETELPSETGDNRLVIEGEVYMEHLEQKELNIEVLIDGILSGKSCISASGGFKIAVPISIRPDSGEKFQIVIKADQSFVPVKKGLSSDKRVLSYRLISLRIEKDLSRYQDKN